MTHVFNKIDIFFTGVQLSDDKNGGISPSLNPGYFNLHLFGLDEPNSICSNHSYEVGIKVTGPRSTMWLLQDQDLQAQPFCLHCTQTGCGLFCSPLSNINCRLAIRLQNSRRRNAKCGSATCIPKVLGLVIDKPYCSLRLELCMVFFQYVCF